MRLAVALILACILGPLTGLAGTLAQFQTPLGTIDVELFDSDKPATVQNFLRYVETGRYQDNFIHRWVPGFVIQGGGFYVTNRLATNASFAAVSPFPTITNEYQVGRTISNSYGTIAMARVGGQTNSATSQWFFNLANNTNLDTVDGGFTVFGRVVSGTNVLNRFNNTSSTNGIYQLPLQSPLNELPVLVPFSATYGDLVYANITLFQVQIDHAPRGAQLVQWQSISNKVHHLQFTTNWPPVWTDLLTTNGTGQAIQFRTTPNPSERARFFRVTVDF